ncbi:MAG: NAD(+) synthase [Gammaproteobacteria bacterium]|nr:NAD(+) synthase [Gammaproteobacteria bacterium]NIR84413.1 NAD(+) synthase [Gammaproteobacteria bacterium]NIR90894.1 NAD(+) synthase [Gammaproteobacteria bacterium]NIU07080.1 NAD(+) synthase [Gammaproteobacteria bacterium]NIV76209.1 NAD(+) synthase [Gammaproteobacteria bacterium]
MAKRSRPFQSIYTHGFLRVATCTPRLAVADPSFNAEQTLELAARASERRAGVALFPELGLCGYSSDDLFFQDAMLDAVEGALSRIVRASRDLLPVLLVGAPLRAEGRLFNCAVVIHRGQVLGAVPKIYLPSYREYYEKRYFASGAKAVLDTLALDGQQVPFGRDLVFDADYPGFSLHVEICEDLWAPIPPSTYAALAGATVLANLSASNITIGKADYRRLLCTSQSAKCIAAYLYTAAGFGESTTDMAWDGHAMIYENGELLAESERFSDAAQVMTADLDLAHLRQERTRITSFNDCTRDDLEHATAMRRIAFAFEAPAGDVPLERRIDRFPYVPSDPGRLDERCYEAYNIQIQGLMKRLHATGIQKAVIGVSGGLDSTQALIVCAKTMDRLGLPRANILAYTLPGFATSRATYDNAWKLMRSLGVTAEEIDIRPSAQQMFQDLGHPFARGEEVYDITFENVQAGERTSHLFRLANFHGGIVVGTGDLSELALGYTTYGVGDHMAHYHVNASVPKTLIQHLIRWAVKTEQFGADTAVVLQSIVDTEISPELVPGNQDEPGQRAEALVGPYELQDFNLYYLSRYGYRPSKVAYLAHHAWSDAARGEWPEMLPLEKRNQYDLKTVKHWLEVFLQRFFEFSQFKRSAIPNAPKVGSGGSLSPRADWRAPSDASARAWIEELRRNVPDS